MVNNIINRQYLSKSKNIKAIKLEGEMHMSVATDFSTLIENLKVVNEGTISTRYKAITKRINLDFWGSESETNHSRYVGSVGRGTAIKGISDIDMLMQLPKKEYDKYNAYKTNGQSALLQAVKNSIKTTYSTTDVGGDGQVVVVQFTDMKFEVLPAFITDDGYYLHPDSNNGGSWKKTDPVTEILAINEMNQKYSAKVKDLGKMARAWKEKCNVPIPGILIDTLAYNFISTWENNDKSFLYYDFMTRDFLNYLSKMDSKQTYWLTPGSRRYAYRNGNFETKAKNSYADAIKAIEYETNSKSFSAKQEWRKIFGSYFPV